MGSRLTFRSGSNVFSVGLLLLSILPFLHEYWWALELPSHFRLHIGVASVALAIVALIFRSWPAFGVAAGAAVVSWVIVLSVPRAHYLQGSGVIIVSQNLSFANGQVVTALGELVEQDSDILVLQEYTPEWHNALAELAERYQYTITVPRNGAFGIAVYSKIPVKSHKIHIFGNTQTPFIEVELDSPKLQARLIAVHFQPPMTSYRSKDRERQLVELKRHLETVNGPFVIVGDFNNTPYSPVLRSFMKETGTGVSQAICIPSWPKSLGWFGIPIDLAVGSNGMRIGSVSAIEPLGSDHRGLRFAISEGTTVHSQR